MGEGGPAAVAPSPRPTVWPGFGGYGGEGGARFPPPLAWGGLAGALQRSSAAWAASVGFGGGCVLRRLGLLPGLG